MVTFLASGGEEAPDLGLRVEQGVRADQGGGLEHGAGGNDHAVADHRAELRLAGGDSPAVEVSADLFGGRFGDWPGGDPQAGGGHERTDVDAEAEHGVPDETGVLHEDATGQQGAGDLGSEADLAAGADDGVVAHPGAGLDHRAGADQHRAGDERAFGDDGPGRHDHVAPNGGAGLDGSGGLRQRDVQVAGQQVGDGLLDAENGRAAVQQLQHDRVGDVLDVEVVRGVVR
ncbi:hypothetical protein ACFQ0M_23670 [Kitasatospora aburaviensis]